MNKKGRIAYGVLFVAFLWFIAAVRSAAGVKGEIDDIVSLIDFLGTFTWRLVTGPITIFGLICLALVCFVCREDILAVWLSWRPIQSAFAIRPICGQTLGTVGVDKEVIARLAIENTSGVALKKCSVRLLESNFLQDGWMGAGANLWPGINPDRGDSLYLRWARSEYPPGNGLYLDIPCDGTERLADCLILDRSVRTGLAKFAAVDPKDLEDKTVGVGGKRWWRLHIRVSAESGHATDVLLVAAYADRVAGPIMLDYWHPRGKLILAKQLRLAAAQRAGEP